MSSCPLITFSVFPLSTVQVVYTLFKVFGTKVTMNGSVVQKLCEEKKGMQHVYNFTDCERFKYF